MSMETMIEIKFQENEQKWSIEMKLNGFIQYKYQILITNRNLAPMSQIFSSNGSNSDSSIIIIDYSEKKYIICMKENIFLISNQILENYFKNKTNIFNKKIYFCSIEAYENFISDTKILKIEEISISRDEIHIFSDEIDKFICESNQNRIINISNSFESWEFVKKSIIGYLIQNFYYNTNLRRKERNQKISINQFELKKYNKQHFVNIGSFGTESNEVTLNCNLFENELFIIKVNRNFKIKEKEIYEKLKIQHPYRIKCFGKLNDDELVLEFIDGKTLQDYKLEKLNDDEKISIILNIMISIEDIHLNNIMYRDLKPTNIIINEYKEAILIDFDSSRNVEQTTTQVTSDIGEVGFASPEQLSSDQYSFETDIFSIGKIIKFIIFNGKNQNETNHLNFPDKFKCFESILNSCIDEHYSNRPIISELINIFYETILSNFKTIGNKTKNTLIQLANIRITQIQCLNENDVQSHRHTIIKNVFEIFNFLMFFEYQDYDEKMIELFPKIEKLVSNNKDIVNYLTFLCLGSAYEDGRYVQQNKNEAYRYFNSIIDKKQRDESANRFIYQFHIKQEKLLNNQRSIYKQKQESKNVSANLSHQNFLELSHISPNQSYQMQRTYDEFLNQNPIQNQNESYIQNQNQSHIQDQNQSHIQDQNQSHIQNQNQSYIQNQNQSHIQDQNQSHIQNQNQSYIQNYSQVQNPAQNLPQSENQQFNQNQQQPQASSQPQFLSYTQNFQFPQIQNQANSQNLNQPISRVQSQPQFQTKSSSETQVPYHNQYEPYQSHPTIPIQTQSVIHSNSEIYQHQNFPINSFQAQSHANSSPLFNQNLNQEHPSIQLNQPQTQPHTIDLDLTMYSISPQELHQPESYSISVNNRFKLFKKSPK